MNHISYGKAKIEDAIRISFLFQQVYIHTYGTEGITFEYVNFINERFSISYIENTIKEEPDQFIVAYFKGNPVGVAEILYDAICPIRKIQTPELSKLYVLDYFNGKGIGHHLLELAEKKVLEKGYEQFWLEVYLENPKAIAFYERQNYSTIGFTDFPMEVNTYKNKVMNKELK